MMSFSQALDELWLGKRSEQKGWGTGVGAHCTAIAVAQPDTENT